MRSAIRAGLLLLIVVTVAATPVFAQAYYVRVLLPIYSESVVPGAYGSLWKTQFAVHNDTNGIFMIDWCSPMAPSFGCTLDLVEDEELLANETQRALPRRYPKPANPAAGAVMYVHPDSAFPPDDPNGLSFNLRVADISRSATSAGTEVPVVRESAFRASTTQLLDVPFDPRFRLAFRLFEMNLDLAEFDVRIFDQDTNELISEQHLTTAVAPQGPLRFHPAFAELSDLGIPAGSTATRARIEVAPLTPQSAFWTYVSITNNESQEFTLVTPQ